MEKTWIGSPFYTKGRGGKKISFVVVHWIVGSLTSADATFNKAGRNASAHYGVGPTAVHQYVQEQDTAWHAGEFAINQQSIGIEHEGGWDIGNGQRAAVQLETLNLSAQLIAEICHRYGIAPSASTIRPHREFHSTSCPGTLDLGYLIAETQKVYNGSTNNPTDMLKNLFQKGNDKVWNIEGENIAIADPDTDAKLFDSQNVNPTPDPTLVAKPVRYRLNWRNLLSLQDIIDERDRLKVDIAGVRDENGKLAVALAQEKNKPPVVVKETVTEYQDRPVPGPVTIVEKQVAPSDASIPELLRAVWAKLWKMGKEDNQ